MHPSRRHASRRAILCSALSVVAFFGAPGAVAAQDEAAIAAARALAQEGSVAAKAGKCEEAVDKLGRAKRIIAAPTILVPLGECQITLGQIVVGTENLQAAAREVLPDDAPKPFVDAQNRARQILPDALKKLARLRVDVVAPAGVDFELTDNGEVVSDALVGVDRPADPKLHKISVKAPGYIEATAEVTLQSGERKAIELKLEVDPNAPKEPPPGPTGGPTTGPTAGPTTGPQPPPTPPPAEGPSALVVGGAVALSLGAAGLIVGGVFGGLASSKKSDLDEVCIEKACPAGSEDDIDDMNTYGNVSTAMFVVGGAAAGLGAILLGVGLASSGSSSEQTTASFVLRPGGFSIEGRF